MPEEPLYENPYDPLSENFEVRGVRLNQRDIDDSASVVEGVVQGKLKALADQTTEPVEIRFLNVGHKLFTPENEKFNFTVQTGDEGIAVVRDVAQLDWTFKIEGDTVGQTYLEIELFREGGRIYQASSIPIEVFMGNMAPNTPSSPDPADNATGISISTSLTWSCTDPEDDPLTYDVYFDTSNPPTTQVSTGQTGTICDPGTLDYNTTYYWKIIAQDNQDHSTDGSVWSFTTTGAEGNQPPDTPSNPSPSDNATGISTSPALNWTCSDPEEDPLTYDVYFGTATEPPLASENQGETSYYPGMLDHNTTYYWKIVAHDDHGNSTPGGVWSFTTATFAEVSWTKHTIDGEFESAMSVYATDVDGDGDTDVLGAAWDGITWWENMGGGANWTEHTIDDEFNFARCVYATNVDGDGDTDVLGAGADNITWWENMGGGAGWTGHTIDGEFSSANSVYATDVDGDGDTDVLGAAYYAGYIAWWENWGDGAGWTEHTIDGEFDGAMSVYATDVDGDGDTDVLGAANWADDITWWENMGGGEEWTKHTIDGEFSGAQSVYATDVDGDGDTDILGAAYYAYDITWWENMSSREESSEHTTGSKLTEGLCGSATDVDAGDHRK